MGATLLLAGIIAAIITAPLFDRVFTHHLAITAKVFVPFVGAAWLSLIWAGVFVDVNNKHDSDLMYSYTTQYCWTICDYGRYRCLLSYHVTGWTGACL